MHFPRLSTRRLAAPVLSTALVAALSFGAALPAHAALSKSAAPSINFDLSHWKLTLPSGSEIGVDQLNAGYQNSQAFYTSAANGGMVFKSPNLAGHTSGSKYSRSELREMLAPELGSSSADANNWTMEQGGTLVARMRVDRVSTTGDSSKVGRVVIGQIHGPDSEPIRLYFHKLPGEAKGRIYAAHDTVQNVNSYGPDIVGNRNGSGIALGQTFTYTIRLYGTRLFVRIRTSATEAFDYVKYIDPGYRGLNLYFKAGVYNQNDTGDSADYVQATFFRLTHTHP